MLRNIISSTKSRQFSETLIVGIEDESAKRIRDGVNEIYAKENRRRAVNGLNRIGYEIKIG